MYEFKLPPIPAECANCKRPINGRQNSPYWPWDTPCIYGPTKVVTCTVCSEHNNETDLSKLKLPDASRLALNKYLALNT